jgi:hypothetical protein
VARISIITPMTTRKTTHFTTIDQPLHAIARSEQKTVFATVVFFFKKKRLKRAGPFCEPCRPSSSDKASRRRVRARQWVTSKSRLPSCLPSAATNDVSFLPLRRFRANRHPTERRAAKTRQKEKGKHPYKMIMDQQRSIQIATNLTYVL